MGKTRRVLKKGKFVITRKGKFVLSLSEKIIKSIKPYCKKIQIVGSIRRKERNPVDIDIALIPKNETYKEKIKESLSRKGKFVQGGEKRATFRIEGVKVELYYTAEIEVGAVYQGEVVRIVDFGAFVNVLPGKDGLVHISQNSDERVSNVADHLAIGQKVAVKVMEVDKQGRVRLSIKEAQDKPAAVESADAVEAQ